MAFFKLKEKVQVVPNIEPGANGNCASPAMKSFQNNVLTIARKIAPDFYRVIENPYIWHISLLRPYNTTRQ